MLALGKDGRGYVIDRRNLGGIGGALADEPVAPARSAPRRPPLQGRRGVCRVPGPGALPGGGAATT